MTLQELEKIYLIKKVETIEKVIDDLKKGFEIVKQYENKAFREPTKSKLLQELNDTYIYLSACLVRDNSRYYIRLKSEFQSLKYADLIRSRFEYKSFDIDIEYLTFDGKIKNNNLDDIINELTKKRDSINESLKTYDEDIKKLKKIKNQIIELIDEYNNINYGNRNIFDGKSALLSQYSIFRGSDILEYNGDYTINSKILNYKSMNDLIDEVGKQSEFIKNNYYSISHITIDENNNNIIKFVYKDVTNIKYDMENKKILEDFNFSVDIFDKFDKLNEKEQKIRKFRACCLFDKNFYKYDFNKEACFVSSGDIDGFYFPNLPYNTMIAFINGEPVFIQDGKIYL